MNPDPIPLAPVALGDDYALFASADRRLYLLSYKPDRLVARLGGDDAARFRADHETIAAHYPTWTADQTLARLWDQGGYSWLATEES